MVTPCPAPLPQDLLNEATIQRLVALLEELGSAVVAYSGGVDSTFLLKVAHAVLGEEAHAVLAFSESLDRNEFNEAREVIDGLGIPLTVIETQEYDNPEYRKNDATRCFHCKTELFVRAKAFAAKAGVPWVLDGSHAGDVGDFRPGLRARDDQGVRSPLMEVGIDKAAIRRYSQMLGLPTWDKPAAPCLSSRIPYGSEVTSEKLRQVEAAERVLRDLGFRTCRVRHHGQVARIEVPVERLAELLAPDIHVAAVAGIKGAGFLHVTVDLEGFRSGSLNAALQSSDGNSGQAG